MRCSVRWVLAASFLLAALRWLLLGAVALIVNWLCLFRAYEYSGIAIATVVYHVQPFLLLLLAALLQGEPLPLNRLPWLVLALVGVGLSSGLVDRKSVV